MAQAMLQKVKMRVKKVERSPALDEIFEVIRFYVADENGAKVDYFHCPQCNKRVDIQRDPASHVFIL